MKISTKDMILVALFSALMAVGAFIKIPFPFVPLTFQPFFCAFAGLMLGSRLGTLSMAIYVALGLAGVPIFTQGGGPMYVLKPSFGYLIGFIAGAYIIGKVFEILREINIKNALVSVMSGLLVIYLIGIPYMYLILKFYLNKPDITMWGTIISLISFIIKDMVLYIIVAITSCTIIPVLKRSGYVH